ncbi:OpgC domain-containing protein [Azospirillum sp. YIM B02556]|uniref:OpgC domain-containing protein n=2 Tax=Azospirillum endophyticum TaxID=2800326 RepID=A0ABS1F3U0_9PROT|nr:OpgC domain-containing protein [Azospirillum endophyticum]
MKEAAGKEATGAAGGNGAAARDLRLDFFRGLALWFIFVNHIPANQISWATPRNFGLSDATEIFVFISGYTAALVYGRTLDGQGLPMAAAQVLHRCWTLYATYIILFFAYTAQIAYTARAFDSPLFAEEMGIAGYFQDPVTALTQAILLKFRPANLDVLPLYIVLLLAFPLLLPALRRRPAAVLAGSAALYLAARQWGWNLPTYPDGGVWYFNPFTWQLLFLLGASLQFQPDLRAVLTRFRRPVAVAAGAVLLASLFLTLSWKFAPLHALIPVSLTEILYPISKTDLDPLRLLHFFALVYLVLWLVPAGASWLRGSLAAPVLACGRQSLHVFCLGVLLSFAGQTVLVHVSGSLSAQFLVTVLGIAAMVLMARFLNWYQSAERSRRHRVAATTKMGT